ncbi:unnamed protein product [Oreochromis niloticus]|nr:unnamed protein product [Mustela putorius furo]
MAAFSRTGGKSYVRVNKCLFVIISLLSLVYVASSLNAKDQRMFELLKTAIKEADRQKAEDKNRNAAIKNLYDLASSLTKNSQLDIFKETLQKAVEDEERLKEEYKYKMAATAKEFSAQVMQLIPQMELVKTLPHSPALLEIIDAVWHALKNTRIYLEKSLGLLQE